MEFSLLGAAAVGVAGLYGVLRWEARRGNAADCTRDLWDTALAAGMAGLVVGRLAAMVIAGTNPLTRPKDIIVIRGGVDTIWASVAALGTFSWLARGNVRAMADAVAPAASMGLAGWHAGCLITDTCLGTPSDLPWAMTLAGSSVTRHPVELYAAILFAVGALVLAVVRRRSRVPGVVGALGLSLAGLARLATEPMRPTLGGGLEVWYAAAMVLGAAGAIFAVRSHRQHAT